MMKLAGNPMIAATGAASAQKISMTIVRIILPAAPAVASGALCASPFSQAARRARCSGCDLVEVLHFVRDFLTAADLPFQFALAAAARRTFTRERVARTQPGQLLAGFLAAGLALQFDDGVAHLQARMLGIAAGRDRADRHGAIEVAGRDETRIGHGVRDGLDAQADGAEKIVPGNLFGSGHVLREERAQIGVADGLGGFANAVRNR